MNGSEPYRVGKVAPSGVGETGNDIWGPAYCMTYSLLHAVPTYYDYGQGGDVSVK